MSRDTNTCGPALEELGLGLKVYALGLGLALLGLILS